MTPHDASNHRAHIGCAACGRCAAVLYHPNVTAAENYEFAGHGPSATGSGRGWSMRADLFAKCPRCGAMLSLDPAPSANCPCGSLYKDADAGRFGSSFGDEAIEIFRRP
jgi:hypothetical protein